MVSFGERLRKIFVCCSGPSSVDEPAITATRGGRTEVNVDTTARQEPVPQTDIHSTAWENPIRSPVDLQGIENVDAVVKRPDDLEQGQLFPISWTAPQRDPVQWGEAGLASEWEDSDQAAKDRVKLLPLPWEGRRGLVPYDNKTRGPSWAEVPFGIKQRTEDIQDSEERKARISLSDTSREADVQDTSAAKETGTQHTFEVKKDVSQAAPEAKKDGSLDPPETKRDSSEDTPEAKRDGSQDTLEAEKDGSHETSTAEGGDKVISELRKVGADDSVQIDSTPIVKAKASGNNIAEKTREVTDNASGSDTASCKEAKQSAEQQQASKRDKPMVGDKVPDGV